MNSDKLSTGIILNPRAGNNNGTRVWNVIEHKFLEAKINFKLVQSDYKNHSESIARDFVNSGIKRIIIIGGDGTLNEVVNGIFSCSSSDYENVSIGMIPVGTGNDWCRSLKIPEDPAQATNLLIAGKTILHDVGTITSTIDSEKEHRYFINVAGIGFDANVAHGVNVDKDNDKRGRILYIKNLLSSLLKSKASKYRIVIDDNIYDKNICSMCVGIGKYNGGGMKQLPDAIVDDGLFDITMIENISKFSIIMNIKNLFDGSFINHHKVSTSKAKKVIIETETPVLSETDGESCGQSPFEFNILPRALKVIVPENFETDQNIELS